MLSFFNYIINSNRLTKICCDLIDVYEKPGRDLFKPSCKDSLISHISKEIKFSKSEISEWKDFDTDYITIAHTLLANSTFDMLSSGNYHLYYGVLNPMKCGYNLKLVYKESMNYAVKNNYITKEVHDEQLQLLSKNISTVG